MARRERPLDVADEALGSFAAGLRKLRQDAGSPPLRELAKRAHYSIATLSTAAGGRKLPSLDVTLAYVRACGGDAQAWEQRWRALVADLTDQRDDVAPLDTSASPRPPYVGLSPFQPEDAEWFFGRERFVEQLMDLLSRRRFVVVFGASGVGKSSVLRAGLLPRWRAENGDCSFVLCTPGQRPVAELATHLARQPDEGELLIVVDQFEELFTLCRDDAERGRFVDMLVTVAEAPDSRCRIVLGVRADFYAHCTAYPRLLELLTDAQVAVGSMTTDELRRCIVQPAVRASCTLEGALLAELVTHASGNAGGLPMLSHALLETWRRRRGNTLTLAGFQAAGGIEGALAHTAESAYTSLTPAQQHLARELFLRLTALGEGTEDTKRRVNRAELPPDAKDVLDVLAEARLISLAQTTVEIAHEALIRAWPRLRRWLAEDRDGLRTHRQLTEATQDWVELEQDPGALYRGARLAVAHEWASRSDRRSELNSTERAFLDASVALRETEQRAATRRSRQLRYLALGLAVLLIAAMVTSVVAIQQRQDAVRTRELAVSRQLGTQALVLADSDPITARLLAVQAFRIAPTMEARSALLSMSAHQEFQGEIAAHSGAASEVAFAPDGHTLISVGRDKTVALWDTTTRRRMAALSAHDTWLKAMALSHDGTTLATGGDDQRLVLWDFPSRTPIASLVGHTGVIRELAISPDGHTLATAGGNRTLILWDVVTRTRLATLTGHTGDQIKALGFSADGRTLASAGDDKSILLWDMPSRTVRARLLGHQTMIYSLAFSPTGTLLASASEDGRILLWDTAKPPMSRQLGDGVNDVAFTSDGHTLATANANQATLWDVDTRVPRAVLNHDADATVNAIAFSPDGHTLAAVTESANTLTLWNVSAPSAPTEVDTFPSPLLDVAYGPDGHTLAIAGYDKTITLWNSTYHSRAATIDAGGVVNGLTFSPDGRTLAAADDDNQVVTLWNVATLARKSVLSGHTSWVRTAVFSPDGRTLASDGADQTVILWDVATGTQLARLTNHTDAYHTGVAFSPDGTTLALTSANHTVLLWNTQQHTPIARLTGHLDQIRAVAFSPDGRTLATGGADQTINLWDLDAEHAAQRICAVVARNFTPEEWAQNIPELPYRETCPGNG